VDTQSRPEIALAASTLRPSFEQAAAAWRTLVQAEREQVERLPDRPRPEDFYAPVADRFRAAMRPGDDTALEHVLALAQPGETWLDIGAGGGRFAVPLARRAGRVLAVEPSAGMRRVLAEEAAKAGQANIEVFDERWPGPSDAGQADVAFIGHVGYDIEAMGEFLLQMQAQARRLCVAIMFLGAPTADFARLWPLVHGEQRVLLPALGEFMALLFAAGARPELAGFSLPPRSYRDAEALHAAARRPLWVREGSAQDEVLGRAVRQELAAVDGGVGLSAGQRYVGVVTWKPRAGLPS
jgi:hypothetical protein